jgi:hypothetical protein
MSAASATLAVMNVLELPGSIGTLRIASIANKPSEVDAVLLQGFIQLHCRSFTACTASLRLFCLYIESNPSK